MPHQPTIRHAAGSLLVVGLSGPELTGLERAWLRLLRPAGIILFRRNIADAAQTRALLDQATRLCAEHSIRAVDLEGGTVNRLREALAPLPSAQAVARTQSPKNARRHGELIARAATAFGFNTTLAPVLDLALPEAAEVMGSRTAGATAAEVVAYARPFLSALAAGNVTACGKHFPGLGGAGGDTHLVTPSVPRTFARLWAEDLAPYRELSAALPLIMVNHAAYPATPGKSTPASVSPFWIATVLRKRLRYTGIVFSDDFEMGGILNHLSIEAASIEALRAGMDLIEICHTPEIILRAYEALVGEAERSPAFRRLLLARARAAARKRAHYYRHGIGRALTAARFAALRSLILRFNEAIAGSIAAAPQAPARTATKAETA